MSTKSSPQTTTTTSEPPKYLQPYLLEGLQQSRNLYYGDPSASPLATSAPVSTGPVQTAGAINGGAQHWLAGKTGATTVDRLMAQGDWGAAQGVGSMMPGAVGPSGFPEAPVIPFSPESELAMQMTMQRAMNGSPVNTAAQSYATKTLNGGFMGSNPYLDAAFNKAQGAVTNAVQSNFGRSGRNPRGVDAAGFAADQYNDLATQIYGGDYQAERNRQQQLVPFSGQLAQQDYLDASQLANVGAQREGLSREYANAPGLALDQYLARLAGFPGSSVTGTTPTERNVLGSAMGGAAMGSMFGPWGALIGGGLGAIYG